jgi:hypothetical protein
MDVSHFTMAGFTLDTGNQSSFAQAVATLAKSCQPSNLAPSDVVCLVKDPSGAELRIGLKKSPDGRADIVSMDPSFAGEGRMPAVVDSDVSDPQYKPFEVTISAHFSGLEIPLIVDLADPTQATSVTHGTSLVLEIAAFSFKPDIFADASAYALSQKDAKVANAENHFIPSGMFFEKVGGAMPDDAKRPVAYADLAATILKCERKTNVQGGGSFWWALVKAYDGATIDVVLDPRSVDGDLKVGEIVAGRFWLSGRIVNQP